MELLKLHSVEGYKKYSVWHTADYTDIIVLEDYFRGVLYNN